MTTCKTCQKEFEVSATGLEILRTLDLPHPTNCETCAMRAMMAIRNERTLYPRKCDQCDKPILSMYGADSDFKILCNQCWSADSWDATMFGLKYKGPETFFTQLKELQKQVPRQALISLNSENCDYCNHIRDSKGCYMCILVADQCERDFYCYWIVHVLDSADCYYIRKGERLFNCVATFDSYNCTYLLESEKCMDCHFSYDLRGCSNCVFSSNLRNKNFVFDNQQLTKEEYESKIASLDRGSFAKSAEYKKKWLEVIAKAIHRYCYDINCQESSGDNLQNCTKTELVFNSFDDENVYNGASVLCAKNVVYGFSIGTQPVEWAAHVSVLKGGNKMIECFNVAYSSDVYFCENLVSCTDCLGCNGLNKKEFCILNKQYTKEEYTKIKSELLESWKKSGATAEFIPKGLYAFAYNESAAQDFYPLEKAEALRLGFAWNDNMPGTRGKETLKVAQIPDKISEVGDDILTQVLACSGCGKNYKIIKGELALYRTLGVPVPRECFDCRLRSWLKLMGERKLGERTCDCSKPGHSHTGQCPKKFVTRFVGGEEKNVFCAECYEKEIV
ncbi:MAG: hypothetical protein V1821_01355 [bacterium]